MGDVAVTYLATDSLAEGIGASQILAYVERLADRGVRVSLHTFEKGRPDADTCLRLESKGIAWHAHAFGRYGTAGGVGRLLRGAAAVRSSDLVHARSDLAAASVMLARRPTWVWDVRSLWVDQRLALGTVRSGSLEERALRRVERAAARRSARVVTLTEAVIPVLARRHGAEVATKATVITTCVDLGRFTLTTMPPLTQVRLLLAGTVNPYYDVPLMVALVHEIRRRRPAELHLVTPDATAWENDLTAVASLRQAASPAEMPGLVSRSHVGLSVCRDDAGISLAGSMPTKLGEFLASGRPVIVNSRLGDAADLVREHRVGVVTHGIEERSVTAAADDLEGLLDDADLPDRCRALAEQHFDLDRAADQLVAIYGELSKTRSIR